MAWIVIDKNGNPVKNKAGESKPVNDATKEALAQKYGNRISFKMVTTPEERDAYFADHKGVQQIARMFPNLAEQYMNGNGGFNFDNIKAGISDAFSLPGRFIGTAGDADWSNLGRRTQESDNLGGKMLRDPMTAVGILSGGIGGKGVQLGADAGKAVIGNVGKWLTKRPEAANWFRAGKVLGAGAAGAGEGALFTEVGNQLNNTDDSHIAGAVTGGAFEGAGQAVASLMRHFGKNLVLESVAALKLGNANEARIITEDEVREFISDPRNLDALQKLLLQQTSGKNLTPFVKDRGETLEGQIAKSQKEASDAINGDYMLGSAYRQQNGEDILEAEAKRQNALMEGKYNGELYRDKSLTKPQKLDKNGEVVYDESALQGDIMPWTTNGEVHIKNMVKKYDDLDKAIKDLPTNEGFKTMTQTERDFLESLKAAEIGKDLESLKTMTPNNVREGSKFEGNYDPFKSDILKSALEDFREKVGGQGVSAEFKDMMNAAVQGMRKDGTRVLTMLNDELKGLRDGLSKALEYSSKEPYYVRKGYARAVDKFADRLNAYIKNRVGTAGTDTKNRPYINTEDKFANYAYNYLYKIQDVLKNQQALDADFITALYGQATNANDTEVQKYIIELLKDLNVDPARVKKFEEVGATYAMLNKARTRAKRQIGEDGMLKGTILAPIEPRKGLNAANSWGYKLQGGNLNLNDLGNSFNNPTSTGTALRSTLYGVGMPAAKYNLGK